jgi:hypothetical protein
LTAISYAKKAGASVDSVSEQQLIEIIRTNESKMQEINCQTTYHPEPVHSYGYAILSLESAGEKPEPAIDAQIHHLATIQGKDGAWYNNLPRPPIQSSDITATSLAIRALKTYSFLSRKNEFERRISKGRNWLWKAKPSNTEARAYQILGLAWSGEDASKLQPMISALLNEQRKGGGWAQLPGLDPDSYATGLALFAIRTGSGSTINAADPAFLRGVEFLLQSQLDDGSWFVARRAFPFQPTMKSGFPHIRDSWISSTGTSWATIALSTALADLSVHEKKQLSLNNH